jgi:hypothetical protein
MNPQRMVLSEIVVAADVTALLGAVSQDDHGSSRAVSARRRWWRAGASVRRGRSRSVPARWRR